MLRADIELVAARAGDLEALIALRIAAMRPSLERIGRFDPDRARQRFIDGFRVDHTWRIEVAGALAGCVAMAPVAGNHLWIDHFYLLPAHQAQGLGAAVMARLMAEADRLGAAVRLSVLLESDANRFYPRFGFTETHRSGVDVYYERSAQP